MIHTRSSVSVTRERDTPHYSQQVSEWGSLLAAGWVMKTAPVWGSTWARMWARRYCAVEVVQISRSELPEKQLRTRSYDRGAGARGNARLRGRCHCRLQRRRHRWSSRRRHRRLYRRSHRRLARRRRCRHPRRSSCRRARRDRSGITCWRRCRGSCRRHARLTRRRHRRRPRRRRCRHPCRRHRRRPTGCHTGL